MIRCQWGTSLWIVFELTILVFLVFVLTCPSSLLPQIHDIFHIFPQTQEDVIEFIFASECKTGFRHLYKISTVLKESKYKRSSGELPAPGNLWFCFLGLNKWKKLDPCAEGLKIHYRESSAYNPLFTDCSRFRWHWKKYVRSRGDPLDSCNNLQPKILAWLWLLIEDCLQQDYTGCEVEACLFSEDGAIPLEALFWLTYAKSFIGIRRDLRGVPIFCVPLLCAEKMLLGWGEEGRLWTLLTFISL